MKRYTNIIFFLLLSLCCWGQTRVQSDGYTGAERVGYELGSGGTQYSNRKPDRHGLLTSQYTGEHHLIGVYIDGAYSLMHTNCSAINSLPGGSGWAIGGVYEYQNYVFRLQTGVGARIQSVKNKVDDYSFTDNTVYDAYHYPYHLHYSFTDRMDQVHTAYLQVPLLLGANFQGIYFFGGVKLDLPLWGRTIVKAIGTTTGTYDQFMGTFEEMDNHGLRKNVELIRKKDIILMQPNVHISAEIGYEWGEIYRGETGFDAPKPKDYRIKLALFADYCLNNMNNRSNFPIVNIPTDYKWDFSAFEMHHVLSSNLVNESFIRNLYVGIKLTLLVGFHEKDECIICGPYKSELGY